MSLEIGDLASRRLVSVGSEQSLTDAAKAMNQHKIGSAVVLVEEGMPGIITERDLLRSMAEGADPAVTQVAQYMTAIAITGSVNWDVREAATRMFDGGFRHLIVLDEDGSPFGILSIRDLVKALLGVTQESQVSGSSR